MENLLKKGNELIKQDKYLEAFSCFSQILYANPKNQEAVEKILFLFDRIQTGNLDFDPDTSNEYLARGIAKFYFKDFDGSIIDYDKVLELDQSNSYALKCKAFTYKFLERHRDAINCLLDAIKIEPVGEYFDDIANNYFHLKQLEKALEYNELALIHSPKDARLMFNYGFHLMKNNRYEDAIIQFQQALKIRPKYDDAENCLKHCLSKK